MCPWFWIACTRAPATIGDTGAAEDADADTGTAPEPERTVGDGVFLYVGSGGNNWDTSAGAIEALFADAGIAVEQGDRVPADLTDDYGVLVLLNPTEPLPDEVLDASAAIVDGGGRLVAQTEHSTYGGHDSVNQALTAAGSSLRSVSDLRSGWVDVTLASIQPLTDGVTTLAPYYAARVDVGSGEPLAWAEGDYVVIGYERVGAGDVVVVGDGSMFGWSLASGDNQRFVLNLATPVP